MLMTCSDAYADGACTCSDGESETESEWERETETLSHTDAVTYLTKFITNQLLKLV